MQAPSDPSPKPNHPDGVHRAASPPHGQAQGLVGSDVRAALSPDTTAAATQNQSAASRRRARAIVIGAVLLGTTVVIAALVWAAMIVRAARTSVSVPASPTDSGDGRLTTDATAADKDSGTATLAALDSPVPIAADDPANGDGDALVTWVIFADFESDACKKFDRITERLRQKYSASDLRIVWKDLPVASHPLAQRAAEIGRAVFTVGGYNYFRAYKNSVFQHQPLAGVFLLDLVDEEVNLSRSAVSTIADSRATKKRISASVTLGNQLKVKDVPTSYINGVTLGGWQSLEKVQTAIESQLAAARRVIDAGTPRARAYSELTRTNFIPVVDEVEEPKTAASRLTRIVREVPIGDSPVRGPQDALVTIVEFADFQCPYCKRIEAALDALLRAHATEVRVVWKDFPLPMHKDAMAAANFARELRKQKGDIGFWLAHDRLFAAQLLGFDNATLLGFGAILKADPLHLSNALLLMPHDSGIKRDMALATGLTVTGTPTFFFNGRKLDGVQTPEALEAAFAEEVIAARAMLAKGAPKAQLYARLTARGLVE
jgi:protein-disulfide isomerase